MRRIRSRDTKPELIVRSLLHRLGYRFSLCTKNLPGKPDIVLPKYNTMIFVHGCFWHRHRGCKYAYVPKSRKAFWQKKFKENTARDKKNQKDLRALGWWVIVVWECQVNADPHALAQELASRLSGDASGSFSCTIPERNELLKVAEKRLHKKLRTGAS